MLLHDIDIHYFAPAGIESPGNVAEQEFKPAPTKKLEEGDTLQKPADVAGHLFRGMYSVSRRIEVGLMVGLERGYYAPTTYFITELMRLGSKGGVPGNNPIMDFIYWLGSGVSDPTLRSKNRHQRMGLGESLKARYESALLFSDLIPPIRHKHFI